MIFHVTQFRNFLWFQRISIDKEKRSIILVCVNRDAIRLLSKVSECRYSIKRFYVFWLNTVMDVISQASRAVQRVLKPLSRPGDVNVTVSNHINNWAGYSTKEALQSFGYRKLI